MTTKNEDDTQSSSRGVGRTKLGNDKETPNDAEPTAFELSGVDLEALSRKDLQNIAKQHGLKANSKSAVLVQQLRNILDSELQKEAKDQGTAAPGSDSKEANDSKKISLTPGLDNVKPAANSKEADDSKKIALSPALDTVKPAAKPKDTNEKTDPVKPARRRSNRINETVKKQPDSKTDISKKAVPKSDNLMPSSSVGKERQAMTKSTKGHTRRPLTSNKENETNRRARKGAINRGSKPIDKKDISLGTNTTVKSKTATSRQKTQSNPKQENVKEGRNPLVGINKLPQSNSNETPAKINQKGKVAAFSVASKTTFAAECAKVKRLNVADRQTPMKSKKPAKFDIKASLQRPITWNMKKGKCE